MRAAIYARVSTSDQDNSIQVSELTAYANSRGWKIFQVYQDQISGAKAKRPGLDQLMKDARLRRFDVVIVWKLDRFGRSLINLVNSILELNSLGIRFICTTQGIDTDLSNPMAMLLLHIMAAFAEFERSMIRERTSAGVAQYKRDFEAGKAQSRSGKNLPPHRPKRIFNRDEVARLRDSGLSLRKIAEKMGIGEGTVFRTLQERSTSSTVLVKERSVGETANLGQNGTTGN
jgi:putative DNA-invertase from lambdoid prophage Rac